MKTCVLCFAALLFACLIASDSNAQNEIYFRQGNQYYSSGSGYQGYNLDTGSRWGEYGNQGGVRRGYDSQGNQWQYERSSGQYYNYGTGERRQNGKKTDWNKLY